MRLLRPSCAVGRVCGYHQILIQAGEVCLISISKLRRCTKTCFPNPLHVSAGLPDGASPRALPAGFGSDGERRATVSCLNSVTLCMPHTHPVPPPGLSLRSLAPPEGFRIVRHSRMPPVPPSPKAACGCDAHLLLRVQDQAAGPIAQWIGGAPALALVRDSGVCCLAGPSVAWPGKAVLFNSRGHGPAAMDLPEPISPDSR